MTKAEALQLIETDMRKERKVVLVAIFSMMLFLPAMFLSIAWVMSWFLLDSFVDYQTMGTGLWILGLFVGCLVGSVYIKKTRNLKFQVLVYEDRFADTRELVIAEMKSSLSTEVVKVLGRFSYDSDFDRFKTYYKFIEITALNLAANG